MYFLILFRVIKNKSGLITQEEKRFLLSCLAGVSFIIMKDFSSPALENPFSFLNVIPTLEAREEWLDLELAVLQLLSGAETQQGLQRQNNLYFCYFCLVFILLPYQYLTLSL